MANDGSVDVLIQQKAIDNIAIANKALELTLKNILAINEASRKGASTSTNNPQSAEKINQANQASIKRLELADQTLVMRKKLIQSEQALGQAMTKENAKIIQNRTEIARRNKIVKDATKINSALTGAYEKLSIKLNQLRKRYKDVAITEGTASKNAKKLRLEVQKLDAQLKKVDRSAGQFQRNVGNYPKQMAAAVRGLRSLASALGLVGGLFLAVRVIKDSIATIRRFEKANATLSAVLQVERKQMQGLIDDSKRLGKITVKSAEEVVALQVAFARLGFSQQEIIDLTEATISGSIAMNAELSETANLVGAMVNSFDDFSSVDAPEIIDILSLATAKSALNFQKLEKGLPIVAGAANAAGVGFTKLVALMGKLADAGIDVSTSSTAIRNIFIQAAAKGADYNEILDMIKGSQDKLTAANDQFGKRAAVSASVLANNIDQIKELDEALQGASGTAKSMADKELDTLDGSIQLLSSAWKGLIIDIDDGTGALGGFLRWTVDVTTGILTMISEVERASDGFAQFFGNFANVVLTGGRSAGMLAADNIAADALKERIRLSDELATLTLKIAKEEGDANSEILFQMQEIEMMTTQQIKDQLALLKIQKDSSDGGDGDPVAVAKRTIDFYNDLIKTTKELRDSTAETGEEYAAFTKKIIAAEQAIIKLKSGFEKVIAISAGKTPELIPISSGGIGGAEIETRRGVDPAADIAKEDARLKELFSLQEEARNLTKDLEQEAAFALFDLGNTLFDRKLSLIDAEIQAEEDKYARLFELAEGNDNQQRLLAIEREESLKELEKKRQKEEKKQAIFNKTIAIADIGIKLAQTIAAINLAAANLNAVSLGTAGTVFAAVQIPLAIGIAAAQTAAVLATPIPQFAKGGTMDHDGLAVVGDGGRKEVIKNPDGSIQVTPDTSTLVNLKKGAEIFPSIEDAPSDITDKIYSATVMASLSINNSQMKGYLETQKIFNDKLLDAMLDNTKAVKNSKSNVYVKSNKIDIPHEMFKSKYTS